MTYSDYMHGMQRDDDTISSIEIIAAYENGPEELRHAVSGMTPHELQARPVAGKWSTIELVAHVADTEIYFTDRIERTIALEKPLLMGVDERPYPAKLNYQEFDLAEQLALLSALRKHAARILKMQPPEAWTRTAVHSETGMVTVRQLVLQAIRHLRHHVPFVVEKRAALAPKS